MIGTKQTSPIRKRILWVIKLCVTIGLGWFLVAHADLSAMGDTLVKMPLGLIIGACIFMLLSVTVSTYKWQVLLKLHSVDFSFSKLHRYYFTALFFNNFLPSSIGGDGYRIYKTFGNPRSPSSSVIAVVMERLTGIVALLAIGYFCSFIVHVSHGDVVSEALMSFGTTGIAITLVAGLLFIVLQGYQRLMRWENKPMLLRIILDHGKDYLRDPTATAKVMLISLYFHVHNSAGMYLLLRYGAGVDISIPELFVVLTLVNLVGVLPISINGLGVVDVTFVVLLGAYGVDKDLALSVMLVSRILLILVSLVGAGFYLTERKDLPKEILSPALGASRH
ncbi:MAG: flippase-like domain-containing protein [Gammaproteobacteria bacterium]|nr:flippase-like domain-containing protein [Gammaproteobacteria bacterium]MBU2479144.1 flippase-like domain-containing protein [Gammaproteobacteria bacterium]